MDIISEDQIFLNQDFRTQQEVFEFLAKKTVELGIANDQSEVDEKLQIREKEGTTGMMDEFAIPHAQSAAIKAPNLLIVRNRSGIEWQSLDGSLTRFIIALFVPKDEVAVSHLKLLSSVARLLIHEEIRQTLKQAASKEEIAALLNDKLNKDK